MDMPSNCVIKIIKKSFEKIIIINDKNRNKKLESILTITTNLQQNYTYKKIDARIRKNAVTYRLDFPSVPKGIWT